MIVNKPISVKIKNKVSRLTVGKPVPSEVLKFWKDTDQLDELIINDAISEISENKNSKKNEGKEEKKESNLFESDSKKNNSVKDEEK